MQIIALLAGIIFSFFYFRRTGSHMLTFITCVTCHSRQQFEALYDTYDDEYTYNDIGILFKNINKYSDYYRLHKAARPTSFKYFQRYHKQLASLLIKNYLLIVLIPTVLFWSHWYMYLIGVFITIGGVIFYESFVVGHRIAYNQRLIIFSVINDYQNSLKKELQKKF